MTDSGYFFISSLEKQKTKKINKKKQKKTKKKLKKQKEKTKLSPIYPL